MKDAVTTRSETQTERYARSTAYLESRLGLLEEHMLAAVEIGLEGDLDAQVARYLEASQRARGALDPVASDEQAPSLERLRRRLSLSDFEEEALLLALAPLVDTRFSELVIELKRNLARNVPDVGLALSLFSRGFAERLANRAAFAPGATLVADNVLQLDQRGSRDGNLLEFGLKPSPRVQSLLLEQDEGASAALAGFSRLLWPSTRLSDVVLPRRQLERVMQLVGQYDEFLRRRRAWGYDSVGDGGRGLVLLFSGVPGTGKTLLAKAIAHELGRPLLQVDGHQLGDRSRLEGELDMVLREARLQRAILFFDECEELFANRLQGNARLVPLLSTLDAFDGIVLMATNLPGILDPALDRRITLQVDFEIPPPGLRERIWRMHLPPATPLAEDVDLPFLAEKYEFAGGHIRNSVVVALNTALARNSEDPRVCQEDFEAAARSQVRHRLKALADRSATHLTLDDLILPDDVRSKLEAIIAAVRNRRIIFDEWGFGEKLPRGKGLCSLFRGDSGTGKTLAAEILANELAMPLYRVRIPAIVDKYVGETEKKLEKCFREASSAGALLLFDEADSIFGKRVEVNSSNDRHSNMEVNLLLQEIERFDGVVILTTNLDAAIDDAFDRRLNFKIDFPFPDARHRAKIWRQLIPDQAPLEADLDYRLLGRDFELSGGSIKNAVVRAAYEAAQHRRGLSTELLEQAAVQEYRELGKLVPQRRNPWD